MRKEINRYLDQPLVSSVSPFYIKCFFFLFSFFLFLAALGLHGCAKASL